NALCPGPVDTPLMAELLGDPARRARRMVHIPFGRLAKASEVAHAALFLASDESSYINGVALTVDGGVTVAYTTPRSNVLSPLSFVLSRGDHDQGPRTKD